MLLVDEATYMLEQWGQWAYCDRKLSLDYPSIEPFSKMQGGGLPLPNISDDVGCYIDSIVSAVIRAHPEEGHALAMYHLNANTYQKLARELNVDLEVAALRYQNGLHVFKSLLFD